MSENNHETNGIGVMLRSKRGFWSRFVTAPRPSVAHQLYEPLVRQARLPFYYQRLGVPDTPEGRFEVLALHVGLAVRRLCGLDDHGREIGQALFDLMVADLDMNMRELGVGDLSVGKQVKRLASQFYARLAVLNDAFDSGDIETLEPMLKTNVCVSADASPENPGQFAAVLLAMSEAFDRLLPDDLKAGRMALPDETVLIAKVDDMAVPRDGS